MTECVCLLLKWAAALRCCTGWVGVIVFATLMNAHNRFSNIPKFHLEARKTFALTGKQDLGSI